MNKPNDPIVKSISDWSYYGKQLFIHQYQV